MNAPASATQDNDIANELQTMLKRQQEAYLNEGAVSAEVRIDRIDRGIDVVYANRDRIVEALNSD